MPVLLHWGIPALILVGGGGYWLMHLHYIVYERKARWIISGFFPFW
jgi:hypothetical protein